MMRAALLLVVLFGGSLPIAQQSPAPAASGVEGYWMGLLRVGVKELRIAVRITRTVDGFAVAFIPLDQGGVEQVATGVTLDDRRLRFAVPARGELEATLDDTGQRLIGSWMQSGAALPISLERRDESAAKPRRPQEPSRPLPYGEIDVMFPNRDAAITLAGTLTLPRSPGPHPAVLLISGSGPQDRNQEIYGHRAFLVIADHLTRLGVAVLRVDDRGVGGSTGARASATLEDYAGDALAAVAFLKARPDIDSRRIGLIGHSEGGLIAPMAVTKAPDIAFVVLLAAPGLPGWELSVAQARTMLRASGASEAAIEGQTRIQTNVLKVLADSSDEATIRAGVREVLREELIRAGDSEATQLAAAERQIEPQIKRALTPWARFFMVYDPRPVLAGLRCPVLALNGTTDTQVPAVENLGAIEAALKAGGNRNATVRPLAGLNHMFQTSPTGALSEYSRIEETFAPAALDAMATWIRQQVTIR